MGKLLILFLVCYASYGSQYPTVATSAQYSNKSSESLGRKEFSLHKVHSFLVKISTLYKNKQTGEPFIRKIPSRGHSHNMPRKQSIPPLCFDTVVLKDPTSEFPDIIVQNNYYSMLIPNEEDAPLAQNAKKTSTTTELKNEHDTLESTTSMPTYTNNKSEQTTVTTTTKKFNATFAQPNTTSNVTTETTNLSGRTRIQSQIGEPIYTESGQTTSTKTTEAYSVRFELVNVNNYVRTDMAYLSGPVVIQSQAKTKTYPKSKQTSVNTNTEEQYVMSGQPNTETTDTSEQTTIQSQTEKPIYSESKQTPVTIKTGEHYVTSGQPDTGTYGTTKTTDISEHIKIQSQKSTYTESEQTTVTTTTNQHYTTDQPNMHNYVVTKTTDTSEQTTIQSQTEETNDTKPEKMTGNITTEHYYATSEQSNNLKNSTVTNAIVLSGQTAKQFRTDNPHPTKAGQMTAPKQLHVTPEQPKNNNSVTNKAIKSTTDRVVHRRVEKVNYKINSFSLTKKSVVAPPPESATHNKNTKMLEPIGPAQRELQNVLDDVAKRSFLSDGFNDQIKVVDSLNNAEESVVRRANVKDEVVVVMDEVPSYRKEAVNSKDLLRANTSHALSASNTERMKN